ncbi:MAG: PD-(D/E)XK nuclease family protein [Polyangiaceae bacterium]|nr:PD-(D/E)XK nuclease family protein [Polyangiaceae bacterium]
MEVHDGDLLLSLAALFALVAVVQTVRILWLRGEPSRRARRRVARALQGEREAERLVQEQGYRILAVQPEYTWQLLVDGRPAQVILRPDLVLEREGRRYIADVKTGHSAPDPLSSATRRQLLEYLVACQVDGVLVVDVEARRIRSLVFPSHTLPMGALRSEAPWGWALMGMIAGAGLLSLVQQGLR